MPGGDVRTGEAAWQGEHMGRRWERERMREGGGKKKKKICGFHLVVGIEGDW